MIGHILDLFHFINSWTRDSGGPEYPKMSQFSGSDLQRYAQFLMALERYHKKMEEMQRWFKTVHLLYLKKIKDEEDQCYFRVRTANNELEFLALEEVKRQLAEYALFLDLCMAIMISTHASFYMLFLLMSGVNYLYCINPQCFCLLTPVAYQAPLTFDDQQRHTRALFLSFERMQEQSKALWGPTANVSHLTMLDVEYHEDRQEILMLDGTRIVHRQEGLDSEIIPPPDQTWSEIEAADRQGDYLAALFYNKFLLTIPEQHHADFWRPTNVPFEMDCDLPPDPFLGMSADHRTFCRMIFMLVNLGLELNFNGQLVTQQDLQQRGWLEVLRGKGPHAKAPAHKASLEATLQGDCFPSLAGL